MAKQPVKPKRVLVVDDESTLAFFLKQDLQESARLKVDVASSGEDALTKLTYNCYELLITDLNMPGINGFTLIEVARTLHPHLKVILITAFGSREIQQEAKDLEVQAYLTKPFPTAQLKEVIETIFASENERTDIDGPLPSVASVEIDRQD